MREHKLANGLESAAARGPLGAGGDRRGLVPRRLEERAAGAQRLRPPLRAPDVQGLGEPRPEEHKNFIASIGGRYNATTDFDRTLYFQSFPSNYLERVLWMEADRMRSLDVSDANFKSERDVVKEERRLRVDNPPFGRLFEVVLDKTFTTHPYRIHPIGSMADLDAATHPGRARLPQHLLRAQQRHPGGLGRLRSRRRS